MLTALARHVSVKASTPPGSVAALIERYRNTVLPTKAARTIRSQGLELTRLSAVFGQMRPEDLQPTDCWTYYTARGGTSAAHHEVRLLSHVFTWALRWGVARINPARGLGLPTPRARTRYVTDEEFAAFHATVPPMIGRMMDATRMTALREGDLLRLEKRHLAKDGILIQPSKTAHSTARVLLIEWTPELTALIDAALSVPPQARACVFCRRDGKRMTESGFQSIWQRLMARWVAAGGQRFTFHDLRAKGLSDEETLQGAADRAGHADPRVTERVYRRKPRRVKPLAILDKTKDSSKTGV